MVGPVVAGEGEPQRDDEAIQAGLEDMPLVEAMLAEWKPRMDGRRVDGRGGREPGGPTLHIRAGQERVFAVTLEEAPAERVEVDEDDARMLLEALLDQVGQLVEAAAQSSRSTG